MNLYDVPRTIDPSTYDEAREEVARRYREIPGVVDAMEFGTVPCPGISDLDTIVVVEPGATLNAPHLKSFTPDHRYVIFHKHFCASTRTWDRIRYTDPWMFKADPLLDSGKCSLPEATFSEEEHQVLSAYKIITSQLNFLRLIGQTEANNTLILRSFLDRSVMITYHYRELHRMGIAELDGDPHIESYAKIRDEWFTIPEQDRSKRCYEVFSQFTQSVSTILALMREWCEERMTMVDAPVSSPPRTAYHRSLLRAYPDSVIVDMGLWTHVYQPGRTEIDMYHRIQRPLVPKIMAPLHTNLCVLPLSLCAMQNMFLYGTGPLSDHYKSCFVTSRTSIPLINHPAIAERVAMTNENMEDTRYIGRMKQPFFSYDFSWMPQNPTWSQRIRKALDRFALWISRSPLAPLLRTHSAHVHLVSNGARGEI